MGQGSFRPTCRYLSVIVEQFDNRMLGRLDAGIDSGTKTASALEAQDVHMDQRPDRYCVGCKGAERMGRRFFQFKGHLRDDALWRGVVDNQNFRTCRSIPSHTGQASAQQVSAIMAGDD